MNHRYFVPVFFVGSLLLAGILVVGCHPKPNVVGLPQQVTPQAIQVHVEGAVVNPGIYFLQKDSRVMDALAAAGGLLPQADRSGINLAAHVYDMQTLEISFASGVTSLSLTGVDNVPVDVPDSSVGDEAEGSPQIVVPDENDSADVYPTITPSVSCSKETIGTGTFVWPVDNHFLSGNDYSSSHPAIDISAGEGSPVYAADSGMVRLEGNDNSGYGNVIEIDHGNGYSTVYAHLSVIGVDAGQGVCAGQRIGAAGSTGNSTGAHLHFEVMQDGEYIDPWTVLPVP